MSAIQDNTDGPIEVIKVLFALYPGYNTLDVAGPLEILSRSLHNPKDKCKCFWPPICPNGPQLVTPFAERLALTLSRSH